MSCSSGRIRWSISQVSLGELGSKVDDRLGVLHVSKGAPIGAVSSALGIQHEVLIDELGAMPNKSRVLQDPLRDST